MRSFKDSLGRSIDLSITVSAIRRIKSGMGVDISDIQSSVDVNGVRLPIVAVMEGADTESCVNVIYLACKPHLDSLGISDEQFGESLGGDGLKNAMDAFRGEWIDFFRNLGRPESIRTIEATGNLAKQGMARISEMVTEAEAIQSKKMQEMSLPPFMSADGSQSATK